MATGCESSPTVSSAPKLAKRSVRHQLQLSFPSERAEGQFSYTVGACKEAVVPQKVGGQRPVHECSAR